MKKVALCVLLIMMLCGCTIVRINTSNIDTIIDVILSKENTLYNRTGRGYKYYVPRGVSYIDTDELNDKLYSNGNYYYLYVDIVSYYQKIENDYREDSSLYYSRKLNKSDGYTYDGYLEIKEKNNLYYITFVYNYAKIETVTKKSDINNVILDSAYILATIQFNDDIVELMVNQEMAINREEKYEIFKNKDETSNSNGLQIFEQ